MHALLRRTHFFWGALLLSPVWVAGIDVFAQHLALSPDLGFMDLISSTWAQDAAGSPAPPTAPSDTPPPPLETGVDAMSVTTPAEAAAEKAQEKADQEAAAAADAQEAKDAREAALEAAHEAEKAASVPQSLEGVPPVSVEPTSQPPSLSSSQERDYDPRIPPHHYFRPQWAVTLNAATRALGDLSGSPTRGFGVVVEFQPRVLQRFGVFGLGPSLSVYPVSDSSAVSGAAKITPRVWSIWSIGGVIRYQGRWIRNQWIVPTAGYAFDRVSYAPAGLPSGTMTQQGPVFGAMILLNALDPDTAAASYADPGIVRSYILAELKMPKGGDTNLASRSSVVQFGLRVEF